MSLWIKSLMAAGLVFSAMSAQAIHFDLTNPSSSVNGKRVYANQYDYSSNGLNLSVTGWSYCGSKECSSGVKQTKVGKWSGLGAEKTSHYDHAIDNANNDFDMLLLEFDQAVSLTSLSASWAHNDSDISLLAYGGGPVSDISQTFTGLPEWSDLLGMGWTNEVGSYLDIPTQTDVSVNATQYTSQYWLIGAYNASLDSAFDGNTTPAAPLPSCTGSHPVACGGRCFTDAAQALSGGCNVNNEPTLNTPVYQDLSASAGVAASSCPASHPLSCGGNCYEDLAQASSGGCSASHIGGHVSDYMSDSNADFFKLSSINVEVSAVPLPGSLVLMLSGLAGLGFFRKRMQKKAKNGKA